MLEISKLNKSFHKHSVLKDLDLQMREASQKMEYEKAAYLRDRKQAIERASAKQKVSNISENSIDVIGIAKSDLEVCVEIFFVRGSKMIGREQYFYKDLKDMEDKEILSGFITLTFFKFHSPRFATVSC